MLRTCASLLEAHPREWRAAVTGPFLAAARDGSLAAAAFDRWLAQDLLFVRGFARLASAFLTRTDDVRHAETLCGGIGALADELRWFEATAAGRGLDLSRAEPLRACREYLLLLEEVAAPEAPYAQQAVVFWAVERAYNEAWRSHSPMVASFGVYAERWGSNAFTAYVAALEGVADAALAGASAREREAARAAFVRVCQLESVFWDMTLAAPE
jgi:thiaminase